MYLIGKFSAAQKSKFFLQNSPLRRAVQTFFSTFFDFKIFVRGCKIDQKCSVFSEAFWNLSGQNNLSQAKIKPTVIFQMPRHVMLLTLTDNHEFLSLRYSRPALQAFASLVVNKMHFLLLYVFACNFLVVLNGDKGEMF